MLTAEFWQSWWAIAFVAGPLLLIVMSFMLSLYIGNRHLDEMLEALKNSRHIAIHGAGLRAGGWIGRHMLVAKITGVMAWPGSLVRSGEVDADDLRTFPVRLRNILRAKIVVTCVIGVWLVSIYAALQLR
jgi:hypothetical protein